MRARTNERQDCLLVSPLDALQPRLEITVQIPVGAPRCNVGQIELLLLQRGVARNHIFLKPRDVCIGQPRPPSR